ncbi:MAG: cupin domain-containing protein [Bacteriovorax sp.]|nr:cupin domain-containing protein [Bacteriovorax sp.]
MTKIKPSYIANYKDLMTEDNSTYPDSDELLAIGAPVGKKLGLTKIGVHIETIPPGRRTSWPHAESLEEEFAHVIKGRPHVWIDGYLHELSPGDFVAFPAGTGIAHTFINNSHEDCILLVGGEVSKPDNKIFYPLNRERNLAMQLEGSFWENHPIHEIGPHDGLPDAQRKSFKVKNS